MIRIKKLNNKIVASGHANYDVEGKDIVCASVTTAFELTKRIALNCKSQFRSGSLKIIFDENDIYGTYLLQSLYKFLVELQEAYPENIIIL